MAIFQSIKPLSIGLNLVTSSTFVGVWILELQREHDSGLPDLIIALHIMQVELSAIRSLPPDQTECR